MNFKNIQQNLYELFQKNKIFQNAHSSYNIIRKKNNANLLLKK